MIEYRDFSTNCALFAREFFHEFHKQQDSFEAKMWITRKLKDKCSSPDETLPYLSSIAMRPSSNIWFYEEHHFDLASITIQVSINEEPSPQIQNTDCKWIIHPDYVRWNGITLHNNQEGIEGRKHDKPQEQSSTSRNHREPDRGITGILFEFILSLVNRTRKDT